MDYLLIIITILFLCVLTYLLIKHKEPFITYVKDRQLIGTIDLDGKEDNRYPLSSSRAGNLRRNEELCYGTHNVQVSKIGGSSRGLCTQNGTLIQKGPDNKPYKITEGEKIPSIGMYAIDFSNYETYYERKIKGQPLNGKITAGNMILTLNKGRLTDTVKISIDNGVSQKEVPKRLTLSKVKSICDELGTNCVGFTIMTPTIDKQDHIDTIFYATIDQNSSDIYSLDYDFRGIGDLSQNSNAEYLMNDKGAMSYIKKNPEYVEKPIVKLDLGSVNFTKKQCYVKFNNNLLLTNMNGTLEQCKTACASKKNPDCVGFVKNNNLGEDSSASCVLHKGNNINYEKSKISKSDCPEGFDKKTDKDGYCAVSRTTQLSQIKLKENCEQSSGTVMKNVSTDDVVSCTPKSENTEDLCLPQTEGTAYAKFATYIREYDD